MMRIVRSILAVATAAALCAAGAASAQYQPVPPPPQAQPQPPPQPQYQPPPPAYQPPPPAAYAPPPVQMAAPPAGPKLQIGAFTGWQVNGDVDTIYGKLVVDDSQSFGVTLWNQVKGGTKLELLWIYSQVDAHFDSYSISYPSTQKFSIMQNYFQLGGVHSFRRGKVEPFAGGTLGAVWYSPDQIRGLSGLATYDAGDTWRFAITLGGGLNVFLSESFAIRGYARMLMPMYFSGGSVYVGTGGSGLAVNAGVPAVSGDFGVALVLAR